MVEKYQNFENQENPSLELTIPSSSSLKTNLPLLKYIGRHRILKRKGKTIIWTLGPHCNNYHSFSLKTQTKEK